MRNKREIDRVIQSGEKTAKEIMMEIGQRIPKMSLQEIKEFEKEKGIKEPIGKYGKMFRDFMEEEYSGRKCFLISEGLWEDTVRRVDREAKEMFESLEKSYERKFERPTEGYWDIVKYESGKRDFAEEIVLKEVVFRVW